MVLMPQQLPATSTCQIIAAMHLNPRTFKLRPLRRRMTSPAAVICGRGTRCRPLWRVTHERIHYLPHNSVCRMTREQSERFLQLPPDYRVSGRLYRDQRTRAAPGGLWVVRGEFFLRYKMDERFSGWGGEDTELLGRIPRQFLWPAGG